MAYPVIFSTQLLAEFDVALAQCRAQDAALEQASNEAKAEFDRVCKANPNASGWDEVIRTANGKRSEHQQRSELNKRAIEVMPIYLGVLPEKCEDASHADYILRQIASIAKVIKNRGDDNLWRIVSSEEFQVALKKADKDMQAMPGMQEVPFPEDRKDEIKAALLAVAAAIPADYADKDEKWVSFGRYGFTSDEFLRAIGNGYKFPPPPGCNTLGQAAGAVAKVLNKLENAGCKEAGECLEKYGDAFRVAEVACAWRPTASSESISQDHSSEAIMEKSDKQPLVVDKKPGMLSDAQPVVVDTRPSILYDKEPAYLSADLKAKQRVLFDIQPTTGGYASPMAALLSPRMLWESVNETMRLRIHEDIAKPYEEPLKQVIPDAKIGPLLGSNGVWEISLSHEQMTALQKHLGIETGNAGPAR